jgi:hypothetical protein
MVFHIFWRAKLQWHFRIVHEHYCSIPSQFILTFISISKSVIRFIHPLCHVFGIGHVNNLHGFEVTYVITYLSKSVYGAHFAYQKNELTVRTPIYLQGRMYVVVKRTSAPS